MPNTETVLLPNSEEYDLVILGSGPGGQRAAVQAAKLKKRVLIIEKENIGGSCLHTGTVPSKALREAALGSQGLNGLNAVMLHTKAVIEDETKIICIQLHRNNIEYIKGFGSFLSANAIQIKNSLGSHSVKAKKIVIATGTRPRRPVNVAFDHQGVHDSDTILNMTAQPRTLAVVGAGVIGCEYASIYARMGVQVTLIDHREELLRSIDQEMVATLISQFKKNSIVLKLGFEFQEFRRSRGSDSSVEMKLTRVDHPETSEVISFDAVLYCLGRMGNVEYLNLAAAGLTANDRGLLAVNTNYQTKVEHIYAVGDVIGAPALAASSAEQGRLAALHAFTSEPASFPSTFPYGIYTIPEISSVGAQEDELKQAGVSYVVGRAFYRELARGKILGDEDGFLKLLVDKKTSKILGVHVIGTGATELVHIGQVAMAFGATAHFFIENVFNYPTLAEAYKVAAYHAHNQIKLAP